ncbi:MAG: tRNA (adenosine(37)-N6)-dimethylallyltransferase MiaA [Flavobacteriaceae bacterium]|nr:MAG: tRNA (adenosine(37)-N6)-dimethylallyltransferase MiaA [Flavobacteriaceae bacterium]
MATLITVVGPTGIGKTALSIQLARYFNTEIISCDSRQFYREMPIGTAVPDDKERASIPHHFIQSRSITEAYNVGRFEKDALTTLTTLFKKYKIVIMVGGSGLYVDAVLKGLDHFPDVDKTIRKKLIADLHKFGIEHLQDQLRKLDRISYKTIAIDNPQRLIRALEVCLSTGLPYTTFKSKPKEPRPFTSVKIGLTADREIIYRRINERVTKMMENGLLEEVKQLLPYRKLNALQTVGYKELFLYLEGKTSLEEAISEIKKNTRRFAKRQLTWFRKDTSVIWFDYLTDPDEISSKIAAKL